MRVRIVPDTFAGWEIQIKYRFWPFWMQWKGTNTFSDLDLAKEKANSILNPIVLVKA